MRQSPRLLIRTAPGTRPTLHHVAAVRVVIPIMSAYSESVRGGTIGPGVGMGTDLLSVVVIITRDGVRGKRQQAHRRGLAEQTVKVLWPNVSLNSASAL
ncbi:hypothetical protein [Limnoglobus roseus]|uniref:hypothetical protein n=1 Tax=Limnoglobus roseus TaxID=2598579 RepID=UPI0011EB1F41|nr:hypothetical protein [Limnoglobus roseus]